MANIDVTSTLLKGRAANNEVGRGWTHQIKISWEDFISQVSATDGDTLTYSLFTIPALSVVESVGYRLITDFADSGSGSAMTMQVGDEDDANGYLVAADLGQGTEVDLGYSDGAYLTSGTDVGTLNGKAYITPGTNKTLEALFTPTGFKLEESTAGEVVIWARIVDTSILV